MRRYLVKPLFWPMDAIYVLGGERALHAYCAAVIPALQWSWNRWGVGVVHPDDSEAATGRGHTSG